jgi:cystathionine beta-synthase
MKLYDVSQLPVLDGNRIVGIVDEEDILLQVFADESRFHEPVSGIISRELQTVPPDAPLAALLPVFDQGMVAIVKQGDEFLGIITRIDLLNYLRRRMK